MVNRRPCSSFRRRLICSQTAQRQIIALLQSVRRTTREVEMTTDGEINLAVLAGDGIGPEITAATIRVLKTAAGRGGLGLALTPYPIGWRAQGASERLSAPQLRALRQCPAGAGLAAARAADR